MPEKGYAARVGTEWIDFTPQHARTREQAMAIARGEHPVPAGAVVGVYGSGKSTLLFSILSEAAREGVLAVWEEASSFLDRLVPATERVSPQEFVERVQKWVANLRTDNDVFAAYKSELEKRQHGEVAEKVEAALRKSTERSVLLLDEMEQAYPHFLQRIDTADHQPLRALIDSCGNSKLRVLMAYAPESFLALGDADRGRMVRLVVPGLDASSIQRAFGLAKGQANFSWWVSRGRARGVVKAINEVVSPCLNGEFKESWLGLAEALDGLPSVFGVPAMLRETLPAGRLQDLLDLVPHAEASASRSYSVSVRDRATLASRIMDSLADFSRAAREDVEVVVDELLNILDALSDEDFRCILTFDDFSAAVKLAGARAIESGRLREWPEGIEPGGAFYDVFEPAESGWSLPFPLRRLAEEVFPSPFTDPVLPLANNRLPAQGEIDRLFADLTREAVVFEWKERGCLIFRDRKSLETWLNRELVGQDESARWRILLVDDAGNEASLTRLAREAGRVAVGPLGRFHACLIKCLSIRADQEGLGQGIEAILSAVRMRDRQLGRKVEWHLSRIGRLLDEIDPNPQRRWLAATAVTRGARLSGVLSRLDKDSPGLLALLYFLKASRPDTRRLLAELGEMLGENSELRKLARTTDSRKQLEGAGVVVDELLPARSGSTTRRWVEGQFPGRDELSEILETYASAESAKVLASLLQPHLAEKMERLILFYAGEVPDLQPQRQQLEGLQGINAVMQRARSVSKGIQVLLGVREEISGLAIGRSISQAFTAQKAIGAFNRLAGRLDKIEEVWAQALALWVAAVFAERIWDGVERDEANLKLWESVSDQGKTLGHRIDERLDEIKEAGFVGVAEFIATERGRLRAGLSDAEQMQLKMQELESTIDQVGDLIGALKALKDKASERGTDISQLLESYRPEAGRISEEREAIDHVVDLLGRIEDEWPLPGGEDFRSYLERLEKFGNQTYAERLRARLGEIIGSPLVSKEIRLDPDDVQQAEEIWPKLSEDFASGCRSAIEETPPAGSDKLLIWIKEAVEKQNTVAGLPHDDRISRIDERSRAWATQVIVRPTDVAELAASRARVRQMLTNLSRSVNTAVIEEVMIGGDGIAADREQLLLERETKQFHEDLEKAVHRLSDVAGSIRPPFPGDSRAAVLANLDVKRRNSEETRGKLHERLVGLSRVIETLGGRAKPIPSPLRVPEAEILERTESENCKKLLDGAWQDIALRLERIGLDAGLANRVSDSSELRDLECLNSARTWCEDLEEQAQILSVMGVALPQPNACAREEVFDSFRSAAVGARKHLDDLNERARVARVRLERMGKQGAAVEHVECETLREASDAVAALKAEADELCEQLLRQASPDAQRMYRELSSGNKHDDPQLGSLVELRRLGLVRTMEDDL